MGLFGPEKMILALDQFNFFPGETVKGTVSINLKKPKKARKLEVALIGQRKERRTRHRNGRTESYWETVKIYDFEIPLGPDGEYQKGDYTFEIKIPENILDSTQPKRPDGALGTISDIAGTLGGSRVGQVEWLVKSNLDIPMGFDVSKTQKIVIA